MAITEDDVQPRQRTDLVANSGQSMHRSAHEHLMTTPRKRRAPDPTPQHPKRSHVSPAKIPLTRPKRQLPCTEFNASKAGFRKYDRLLPDVVVTPSIDPSMFRRLCAVQGGPAIRQLCSLVIFRRKCETDVGLLQTADFNVQRTVQLLRSLELLSSRPAHDKVLIRLLQFRMAQEVDGTRSTPRCRADTHEITKTMEEIGWPLKQRGTLKSSPWVAVCFTKSSLRVLFGQFSISCEISNMIVI